ncbi:MAG TPA: cytochrome o ubiquinol oxidase subunit IV [Candidatus Saccharimonadales bacterium]|jgi:cytochrome o ubiquinol oxidase operon protein cyoD
MANSISDKSHSHQPAIKATPPHTGHATLRSYVIGYVLSLVLTIEAFLLVTNHTFSSSVIITTVIVLAIIQLFVQLFFFLHLDRAAKAPWNISLFLFMVLVVLIIVLGSLWIMGHLHYNMTSPAELDQRLLKEEGITKGP